MNRICMMFWICACCISTSAQIEIDLSQLIDTKWEKIISGSKYDSTTTLFTIDEMIDSTYNSLLQNMWVKKEEGVISLCITLRSMKLTTTPSCHLQMTN